MAILGIGEDDIDAKKRNFEADPVGNMVAVGATDDRRCRIWVRSLHPGKHRLELWRVDQPDARMAGSFEVPSDPRTDGTTSVCWPDDFAEAEPLAPCQTYAFRVQTAPGLQVGTGHFETAPRDIESAPEHFAIAVMSCHQPFSDEGELEESAKRQLATLETIFAEYHVKRVMLVGDQMYADMPEALSLFSEKYYRSVAPREGAELLDLRREEVRKLYQQRFRIFWKDPWTQRMLAHHPCYPIIDDHEIVDNFGSAPEHAEPAWSGLREGGLDACFDYQGLRMQARPAHGERPASMHFSFTYGPVAAFVMDIRSERRRGEGEAQVYGERQLADLGQFLEQHGHYPVLLLGLSVPLVHVPDWLATSGALLAGQDSDAADRWSHEDAKPSRDRLLSVLHDHQQRHPRQKFIHVGGDVHVGMAARMHWHGRDLVAHQLISSALSNLENPLLRALAGIPPRLGETFLLDDHYPCELALLDGEHHDGENPFSGLNVGIIEITRVGQTHEVRFRLVSHTEDGPVAPRVVFSSAPF